MNKFHCISFPESKGDGQSLAITWSYLMNVGDLVRNIFTEEIGIVTGYAVDNPSEYVEVICKRQGWLVPIEHLEVIQCNQVI